jgi:hypothetical protein
LGKISDKWTAATGGLIFHASDCETDNNIFAAFRHSDNQGLYEELVGILCESKLMGYGLAIDLVGWNSNFPEPLKDMPCYTCFRNVLYVCGYWVSGSIPQKHVKFTFDQRRENEYSAGSLYEYMMSLPKCTPGAFLLRESFFRNSPLDWNPSCGFIGQRDNETPG